MAEEASSELGVLTFNMQHKDRPAELKVMADRLRSDLKSIPDFIVCQEVMFQRGEAEDNTAAVLAKFLGYHCRGTKRKSDREGIAIISRYPFTFYGERHLKSQTSPLLLGFNRVSVMGEFVVPKVGLVRVVNVHLTNWPMEGHVRRKQLAETLEWIEQRQAVAPAAATFLGGDFNARRNWGEMDQLAKLGRDGKPLFQDFNSSEPSMGSLGNPDKRIDYVFATANRPLRHLGEKMMWREGLSDGRSHFYLSDHLAVLQRFAVTNAEDRPLATTVE